MSRLLPVLLLVIANPLRAATSLPADHAARMQAGTELFEGIIGPALKSHCLECHGGEKTRAGFNLATRELLLAGGDSGVAVVPGAAASSLLLTLIRHDEEPAMPPKKPKLPESLLADFEKWIDLGAPYAKALIEGANAAKNPLTVTEGDRDFWAFRRLGANQPPRTEDTWAKSELDRFIFSKAREHGLHPNPEADPVSLARRASLDLLGLPPTPEEMDIFLDDQRRHPPSAFGNFIDRLLASPHYGERQARHWMDVARFGESEGFEHDYDRKNAYHYRDFLIEAFNRDLPWDVFTSWQIAGDELDPNNPLALMATGFLAAGAFPTQLTEAEFERARYDELDDMAGTTAAAFLGLSVSCARCHDHKYDPIPASDYYRFTAAFATAIRSEKELEFHRDEYPQKLRPWENRRAELEKALSHHDREKLEPAFTAWLKKPTGTGSIQTSAWSLLEPTVVTSREKTPLTRQADGSWLAGGTAAASDEYAIEAEIVAGASALRIEALTHESMPRKGPGRAGNGNFAMGDLIIETIAGGNRTPLKFVEARATHQQNDGGLSVKSAIDDDPEKSGWAVDGGGIGEDQAAIFVFERPLAADCRVAIRMRFHVNGQHSLGRFRLAVSRDPSAGFQTGKGGSPLLADGVDSLKRGAVLTDPQRSALREWFASNDAEWKKRNDALQSHLAAKPSRDLRTVMICSEGVPKLNHHANGRGYPHFYPEVHVLERGDPRQRREVATASFLQVLMPPGADGSQWRREPPAGWTQTSFRRASLAAWMTDVEAGAGPLLARVIVNRAWQHHFGRGLVTTPNDFGFQGERPTHPELLEWLAADFIKGGWSLKRLHRQIMMSAVYRQSTAADPADAARDPENRFLWRYEPRRLEGEAIRDSLLAVSGLLDLTPLGPGSLDESMRRRSVYFTVKRSKPVTSMLVFDWPEHLVSIGARPITTVAPQSLYLMNSPQVRQCAEALAKRSAGEIETIYRHALGRPPSELERVRAKRFLETQASRYEGRPDAADRALTDYSHALLGSNEFLYLP